MTGVNNSQWGNTFLPNKREACHQPKVKLHVISLPWKDEIKASQPGNSVLSGVTCRKETRGAARLLEDAHSWDGGTNTVRRHEKGCHILRPGGSWGNDSRAQKCWLANCTCHSDRSRVLHSWMQLAILPACSTIVIDHGILDEAKLKTGDARWGSWVKRLSKAPRK